MDILIHAFSGVAVGSVISSFSNKSIIKKTSIPLEFCESLPDFNAISLWSKFDNTIGSLLNLSYSGK